MKKRNRLLIGLLAFLLLLTACAQPPQEEAPESPSVQAENETPPEASPAPSGSSSAETEGENAVSLSCRIVDGAEQGTMLLAGEDGNVYTLSLQEVPAISGDGALSLRDGMTVTVTFSGDVLETYPAQFASVSSLSAEAETDDRCGLYLQVLEDLWETDSGLNGDIVRLGVDLSGVSHLTEAERAAVAWRFAGNHGLELVTGTWEELCDAGYIDRENLVWEDGLFFSVTTGQEAGTSGREDAAQTAFEAQKWRSGLGAYFFLDCVGERQADGIWTYDVGGEAIS